MTLLITHLPADEIIPAFRITALNHCHEPFPTTITIANLSLDAISIDTHQFLLDTTSMDKSASLEMIADVSSGVAIDRRGAGARVVMVGDLEAKGLMSHSLKPAGAPSSGVAARLREFDVLISLRGKVNNAAVYANAENGDEPTFASLDLGVLRLRKPSEVKAMALAIWLNLPSTQKSLSGSRRGSVMLRLPLPALRRLEVPILSDRFEKLLVEAWADAKQAERVEMEIRDLRAKMINEMFRRAVERTSDLTEDGAIK